MSLRQGAAFLEALRDGREIWLDGERVRDVPGRSTICAGGAGPGHALAQSSIKDLAKAEFLLGIAYNLAESIDVLQFPNAQNNLREMITVTEICRSVDIDPARAPMTPPPASLGPPALDSAALPERPA